MTIISMKNFVLTMIISGIIVLILAVISLAWGL